MILQILKKIAFVTGFFSCFFATAQQGEFEQFWYELPNQTKLPYVIYKPLGVKNNEKLPLIVYLHGAISRPTASADPVASSKKTPFWQLADELGCYVLFPYGQKDATWFNETGVTMVLNEIETTKTKYNINQKKVFLSGFSDGASGTFYFASAHSTPFAGFIALNGSVSVAANLGKTPVYLENFNNKPFYIVNTKSDMLYPEKMMRPTIEKIQQYNTSVIYQSPEGNHETSYFPLLKEEIKTFIEKNSLSSSEKISFETADPLFSNQFDWLKITQLHSDEPAKDWHIPYSLKMTNDKASFGLVPDTKHTGESMRVAGFGKNSIAKEMGVQVGDLILKMEEVVLQGPMSSFTYLAGKKAGETTSLTILRDGKELVLEGKFPPAYEYEVFAKNPPSGKIKAILGKNEINIETSKIKEIEIDFNKLPFKKGSSILLNINGKSLKIKAKNSQKITI